MEFVRQFFSRLRCKLKIVKSFQGVIQAICQPIAHKQPPDFSVDIKAWHWVGKARKV